MDEIKPLVRQQDAYASTGCRPQSRESSDKRAHNYSCDHRFHCPWQLDRKIVIV